MDPLRTSVAAKPEFFDLSNPQDRAKKKALASSGKLFRVVDEYESELRELYAVEHPEEVLKADFKYRTSAYLASVKKQKPLEEQGLWVHFPWSGTLVHILRDLEYQKVRTARNRNLITEEEQKKFYDARVGIAGLSVGNSIALAIALQGGAHHMKLADHDVLELSNLNRINAGVSSLGVPKAEITARQIYELNPYAELELFPDGLTSGNLHSFVSGLDLVIDEVDQFTIKYQLREAARLARIPVIMATDNGNGVVIDIERYDLDPQADFFHGRFGHVKKGDLEKLEKKDTGFLIAWHVDMENIPARMWSSYNEIGKTLASWPQLAGAALMNGAAVAHAVRVISSGEKASGRATFSFDDFLPLEPTRAQKPADAEAQKALTVHTGTDALSQIIDAALLAPSGDNIQPWKIRRTETGFLVRLDGSKDHSLYNTGNRAAFISLGAMVENAMLMAGSLGKSITCAENFSEGTVSCTLHESAKNPESSLLADAIPRRVTNRHQFEKKVLPSGIKEFLAAQATSPPLSGVRVALIEAPAPELTRAISMNEKLLFENEAMHNAFFETLRWTPEPWGLPVETLALPLPGLLVFKLAKNWTRFQKYNTLLHFSDVIPKQTASLYNQAGAYIIITGDRADNESFYNAGRLLERLWLAATVKGVSVQPMTGIIFLHHALSINRKLPFTESERALIEDSYETIRKTGRGDTNVLFALRLGFCVTPGIHSPRQTLAELSF